LSDINSRKKLDKEAQYSYEIYFMDNLGTDVYTDTYKAVYIKTDNPNNYAVGLKVNGESILQMIYSYDSTGKRCRYYDDVEYLDIMDYKSLLCKVPGGYLGIIYAETAGKVTVEVQELSSEGYVVAKTFSMNVLDYETARNAWIDNVIETQTDSTMNPKEKMDAISKYLTNGEFKYLTGINGFHVTLAAQPNSPWFLSKRWDSATSPAMLAVFAERIGGFEEIHNCYGDYPRGTYEWQVYHHQTYVVYNGEKYYYTVCPLSGTGDVGTVKMIDFNDTAQLKRIECAIEHSYKTVWSTDDEKHWHQCYSCDDKVDVSEHSYDNIFDTDCNDCGHIREPEGILGDVNNDGEANNLDAAIVLKYDAGILEEFSDTQRLHSDVDRDGEITNIDASLILKYDAGIIEKL